ncbi:MAG: TonB-dependent receptor plug domain-containing protein [Bacteroidia bacterium]
MKEAISREAIVGASVVDSVSQRGVYTNDYGFFSISVSPGEARLRVSIVSFESLKLSIMAEQDTTIMIALSPMTLSEVEILADREERPPSINRLQISLPELLAVPALLGEKDLIKSLALSPGVSVGTEGSSGLLVRGGSPDQNLIILDDATVYNASHLFGFVSVFNTDAIKNVELYKGGFPARYGGRLSSVLDIKMKEGNREQRKREASIGIISSRLLLEGPIGDQKKTSYFLSGRASYLGLVGLPVSLAYRAGSSNTAVNYWLYDLNAKLNHTFKDNGQLYLSFYNGFDNYTARDRSGANNESRFTLNWANLTGTMRYTRILHPRLFLRTVLSFSQYQYQVGSEESAELVSADTSLSLLSTTDISSRVQDLSYKLSVDWYWFSESILRSGIELIEQDFRPGLISRTTNDDPVIISPSPQTRTRTASAFIENETTLFDRIKFQIGLRASSFALQDSSFQRLEPRVMLEIALHKHWSLQAGYSIMHQNMFLLSSNGVGLPTDIWVPATRETNLARSEQYNLGLSTRIPSLSLNISVEGYFKTLSNLIDYRAGSSLLAGFDLDWQEQILRQGEGEIYGVETLLHKRSGKWTGWLAYTWSVNQRRYDEVNAGNWFPDRYDRRHDISLTASYQLNEFWRLSGTWVYTSGARVTLPIGVQEDITGMRQLIYRERNNGTLPAYHRLDIGAEYIVRPNDKRSPSWNFSVYNLYNRQNPFYLEVQRNRTNTGGLSYELTQRSLFPFLPSVAYSWHF